MKSTCNGKRTHDIIHINSQLILIHKVLALSTVNKYWSMCYRECCVCKRSTGSAHTGVTTGILQFASREELGAIQCNNKPRHKGNVDSKVTQIAKA